MFLSQVKLDHHMFDEHQTSNEEKNNELQCKHCQALFPSKLEQVLHSVECSAKPTKPSSFPCSTCTRVYTAVRFLKNHVRTCSVKTDDKSAMNNNRIKDDSLEYGIRKKSVGLYSCKYPDCLSEFKYLTHIRRHYLAHNVTWTTCSKCNKKFPDRHDLNDHAWTEHKEELFRVHCPMCEVGFPLKADLRKHLTSQHVKPWLCTVCAKPMTSLAAAQYHKEKHRQQMCDVCPVSFHNARELFRHLVHHNVAVLGCPVPSCLKYFGKIESFEEHLLDHQKDKIFHCTTCEYQCYNMRQLEKHLESDHVLKPCPWQFTSEVVPSCSFPTCLSSFEEERIMVNHRRTNHPDWNSDLETDEEDDDMLELNHKELGKLKAPTEECIEALKKSEGCVVRLDTVEVDDLEDQLEYYVTNREEDVGELKSTTVLETGVENMDAAVADKEIEIFGLRSQPSYLVEYVEPADHGQLAGVAGDMIPEYVIVSTVFEEVRTMNIFYLNL